VVAEVSATKDLRRKQGETGKKGEKDPNEALILYYRNPNELRPKVRRKEKNKRNGREEQDIIVSPRLVISQGPKLS